MLHYAHSFQPETRRPVRLPPPGSCDAQIHVYGDPARYPYAAGRVYDPVSDATFDRAQQMHRTLGIAHGVVVQPTAYGTDHRLLLDCLAENPAYRGTAIVDDGVSDEELTRLHAAGVRGARFNFTSRMGAIPDPGVLVRSVARIAELGWHAKIRTSGAELLEHVALLRRLRATIVLDHMGHLDDSLGPQQPACRLIVDLLANDGWWIMLSNADKRNAWPCDAAVPIAQAFIAAAPERALWATDWPHMGFMRWPVPNDADLLELLYRYAPDDATLHRILVDNPHRLYGFARETSGSSAIRRP
jgi:predicted TIM-barrel fold metal-dependent hydrolase